MSTLEQIESAILTLPTQEFQQLREVKDGISWFWIGTHAEYDKLIG